MGVRTRSVDDLQRLNSSIEGLGVDIGQQVEAAVTLLASNLDLSLVYSFLMTDVLSPMLI